MSLVWPVGHCILHCVALSLSLASLSLTLRCLLSYILQNIMKTLLRLSTFVYFSSSSVIYYFLTNPSLPLSSFRPHSLFSPSSLPPSIPPHHSSLPPLPPYLPPSLSHSLFPSSSSTLSESSRPVRSLRSYRAVLSNGSFPIPSGLRHLLARNRPCLFRHYHTNVEGENSICLIDLEFCHSNLHYFLL